MGLLEPSHLLIVAFPVLVIAGVGVFTYRVVRAFRSGYKGVTTDQQSRDHGQSR